MANPKARLNFVLSLSNEAKLDTYEEFTGRKQAAVIRQLVVEWLEGARSLPEGKIPHPTGRRTNVNVPWRVRSALDARLAEAGSPTMSAVVDVLLTAFLAHRAPTVADVVTVSLQVPVLEFNKFVDLCSLTDEEPESAILEMIRVRVRESVIALKEQV